MDQAELDSLLNAHFTELRLDTPAGRVFTAAAALSLSEIAESAANEDEDEADVIYLIQEQLTTLVSFTYEEAAGEFSFDLKRFDPGNGRQYVFWEYTGGDQEEYFVAKLEPQDESNLFAQFLADFLSENGLAYGPEFLGTMPAPITNYAAPLISRDTLKEAIWRWCNWAENGPFSWSRFAEDYGLEPPPGDVESEQHRRALLDRFFERCYEERRTEEPRWVPEEEES